MAKRRGVSYEKRVEEINRIYDQYAKRGVPNREIWRRYVYPVYAVTERTFYNILNASADASKKIADEETRQLLLFNDYDYVLTNVLSLTLVTRTSVEGVVRCRDADDEKFLNLAFESRADFLFTKDKNVLRSGRRLAALGIKTQKPAEFDGL